MSTSHEGDDQSEGCRTLEGAEGPRDFREPEGHKMIICKEASGSQEGPTVGKHRTIRNAPVSQRAPSCRERNELPTGHRQSRGHRVARRPSSGEETTDEEGGAPHGEQPSGSGSG